jgi:hypothetical protein
MSPANNCKVRLFPDPEGPTIASRCALLRQLTDNLKWFLPAVTVVLKAKSKIFMSQVQKLL